MPKKVKSITNKQYYILYRVYPFFHIVITRDCYTFSEFAGTNKRHCIASFPTIIDAQKYLDTYIGNYELNGKLHSNNNATSRHNGNTGRELFDLISKSIVLIVIFGLCIYYLI